MNIDFTKRFNHNRLTEFAEKLKEIQRRVDFKISARGWCYQLEVERFIDKDQFNKVESLINKCRKLGYLPVDFVAEDDARSFEGVKEIDEGSYRNYVQSWINALMECGEYYTPDWWENEDYYIQMLVKKIDLKTLFEPICKEYKIPIATSRGWSSLLQRAIYARRFKEADDNGLTSVLLYCGDHDPDGLRISDFIRSNLNDLKNIEWSDGEDGYDPENLVIDRFGLNHDFIQENSLIWIDNLITGSGGNLASPLHRNHKLEYVQDYLKDIGERKCEANALVTIPNISRGLCRDIIEHYLGDDALERFAKIRESARNNINVATEVAIRQNFSSLFNNDEDDDDGYESY